MRPAEIDLLDPLTGVYSRSSLKNRLQEEVDRAERYGQPFSIVLLDLDHFKSVNDAYGHRRGDDVLVELAQRLNDYARKSDVIFRYGGDEFIILLPSTDKASAVQVARRLFEQLNQAPFPGTPALNLTSSIGIASYPEDAGSPESLFDIADKRHYLAKRMGRNQIVSEDTDEILDPLKPGSSSRLIDREPALSHVYHFFEALATKHQGVLVVKGMRGVGKSRFLEEVAKIGRLHGHQVFPITAKPPLKHRALGALLEAESEWENLPSLAGGATSFLTGLEQLLRDKGNIGAVFTIDQLDNLDRYSVEILERIFYAANLSQVAIAYTNGDDSFTAHFSEAPLKTVVPLTPLSLNGVRIWIRNALRWEAPDDFVLWLHENTRGIPSHLQRGIERLLKEGLLTSTGSGWSLATPTVYKHYPLRQHLVRQKGQPPAKVFEDLPLLVGRQQELQELKKIIRSHQLTSLTGAGGMGKRRLAIQAALELDEEFPDGIFVISLTGTETNETLQGKKSLLTLIAASINLSLASNGDMLAQLIDFLEDKKLLLLFNQVERISSIGPILEKITAGAPQVHILAIHLSPNTVPGWKVMELGGLDFPDSADTPGAERYDAVQLFQHHAVRANPEFSLDEDQLEGVIRICRLVGGMPLGIELAANWVGQFSTSEIADQIEENYQFLSNAYPDSSPERQSIQAVFDYFWNLLSLNEQLVLAKLSVFENAFDSVAAARVAEASDFFLGALSARGFLTRSPTGSYQMHPLLRQYAAQVLKEHPVTTDEARLAHSRYYLEYLESLTKDLRGRNQREARDAIHDILDNILSAWNWSILNQRYDLIARAADALFLFFDNQGEYLEGDTLFQISAELMKEGIPIAQHDSPMFRKALSKIRLRGAVFRYLTGHIREAREMLEECLQIALEQDDAHEIALAYEHLGWVFYDQGKPRQEVIDLWEKSLTLYRENDFHWGVSRLLYNLSFISPLDRNQALMLEKLEIDTRMGDMLGVADSLLTLGRIYEQLGEINQAIENTSRCLEIYKEIGNVDGVAFGHFGMGDIYLSQGAYDQALASFEKALHLFSQTGNVNGISTTLLRIGRVAIRQGDFERAHVELARGLAKERKSGSQIGLAYALNDLGELALAEGDLEKAGEHIEESCTILRSANEEWGMGRSLANLALVELLRGHLEKAEQLARESVAISSRMGETSFIHTSTITAAKVALKSEDFQQAKKWLHQALEQAQKRNSPPLMLDALITSARLYLKSGGKDKAVHLLQIISQHPATAYPTRQRAFAMLKELQIHEKRPIGEDDLRLAMKDLLEQLADA